MVNNQGRIGKSSDPFSLYSFTFRGRDGTGLRVQGGHWVRAQMDVSVQRRLLFSLDGCELPEKITRAVYICCASLCEMYLANVKLYYVKLA